jgi:hypothetical protein
MTIREIPRPQPNDAPSWSFAYIRLINDTDILGVLQRQREICKTYFASIGEERSLYSYAPGKWTIRDVLNHVNDAERTFAYRAFWFARGFNDALPDFDQDIAVPGAEANRIGWKDLVEEFDHLRQSSISLFANMPEAGWNRAGVASGHHITVPAIAYLIPGHVAHHLNVLREKYS